MMSTRGRGVRAKAIGNKPRPLKNVASAGVTKCSPELQHIVDEIDAVAKQLIAKQSSLTDVWKFCAGIKRNGPELEEFQKDFMDELFNTIRTIVSGNTVGPQARVCLLNLVEQRARQWKDLSEENYFKVKTQEMAIRQDKPECPENAVLGISPDPEADTRCKSPENAVLEIPPDHRGDARDKCPENAVLGIPPNRQGDTRDKCPENAVLGIPPDPLGGNEHDNRYTTLHMDSEPSRKRAIFVKRERTIFSINKSDAEVLVNPKVTGFIAMATETTINRLPQAEQIHQDDSVVLFEILGDIKNRNLAVRKIADRCGDRLERNPVLLKKNEGISDAKRIKDPSLPGTAHQLLPPPGKCQMPLDEISSQLNVPGQIPRLRNSESISSVSLVTHISKEPQKVPGREELAYEISVPNASVGRVIGNKGMRINKLQEISKASVSILGGPQDDDRTVVIQAKSTDILHHALQMIEDLVDNDIFPVVSEYSSRASTPTPRSRHSSTSSAISSTYEGMPKSRHASFSSGSSCAYNETYSDDIQTETHRQVNFPTQMKEPRKIIGRHLSAPSGIVKETTGDSALTLQKSIGRQQSVPSGGQLNQILNSPHMAGDMPIISQRNQGRQQSPSEVHYKQMPNSSPIVSDKAVQRNLGRQYSAPSGGNKKSPQYQETIKTQKGVLYLGADNSFFLMDAKQVLLDHFGSGDSQEEWDVDLQDESVPFVFGQRQFQVTSTAVNLGRHVSMDDEDKIPHNAKVKQPKEKKTYSELKSELGRSTTPGKDSTPKPPKHERTESNDSKSNFSSHVKRQISVKRPEIDFKRPEINVKRPELVIKNLETDNLNSETLKNLMEAMPKTPVCEFMDGGWSEMEAKDEAVSPTDVQEKNNFTHSESMDAATVDLPKENADNQQVVELDADLNTNSITNVSPKTENDGISMVDNLNELKDITDAMANLMSNMCEGNEKDEGDDVDDDVWTEKDDESLSFAIAEALSEKEKDENKNEEGSEFPSRANLSPKTIAGLEQALSTITRTAVVKQPQFLTTVIRRPLFPDSSPEEIDQAQLQLTGGKYGSVTRRAKFARRARKNSKNNVPVTELKQSVRRGPRIEYTREFLLSRANSKDSKQRPPEWEFLRLAVPEICLESTCDTAIATANRQKLNPAILHTKATQYFDEHTRNDTTLNGTGERWFKWRGMGMPTKEITEEEKTDVNNSEKQNSAGTQCSEMTSALNTLGRPVIKPSQKNEPIGCDVDNIKGFETATASESKTETESSSHVLDENYSEKSEAVSSSSSQAEQAISSLNQTKPDTSSNSQSEVLTALNQSKPVPDVELSETMKSRVTTAEQKLSSTSEPFTITTQTSFLPSQPKFNFPSQQNFCVPALPKFNHPIVGKFNFPTQGKFNFPVMANNFQTTTAVMQGLNPGLGHAPPGFDDLMVNTSFTTPPPGFANIPASAIASSAHVPYLQSQIPAGFSASATCDIFNQCPIYPVTQPSRLYTGVPLLRSSADPAIYQLGNTSHNIYSTSHNMQLPSVYQINAQDSYQQFTW